MHVLLLGADYYGTLAAARCYGRHGIDVVVADANASARALYSRFASRRLVHPPLSNPERLVDWLLAYGERNRGALLYPPNDHLAWLFAAHGAALAERFTTYAPPEESVFALLDKQRLHAACARVGVDVPATWTLGGEGARSPVVDELRFPVLLKPRTQVLLAGGTKGVVVASRGELAAALERFASLVRFAPLLTSRHPDVGEPLVQEYLPAAETNIVSVSGFVTRSGEIVARTAVKVLQRPRKVGIGLCFEGRDAEEDLSAKIAALCEEVGYFGAFEAELIADGERRLLIDFNPRFYSQMAFDVARGLPIPMLVWHAARGDEAELAAEMARARAWRPSGSERYCHGSMLDLVLTMQRLSGRMSRVDVVRWKEWRDDPRALVTDAVRDPDDRAPAVIDAAQWLRHFARHPRSFFRSYVMNR